MEGRGSAGRPNLILYGIDGQSFLGLVSSQWKGRYEPLLYAELSLDEHVVTSLIDGSRKVIRRREPEANRGIELFHLEDDPLERRNLAALDPEEKNRLVYALDRMDDRLTGGVHLEFANAAPMAVVHRLEGALTAKRGRFNDFVATDLEPGDRFEREASGSRIAFSLQLRNVRNPLREEPFVLVDVDRARFTVEPKDAELVLSLTLDGTRSSEFDFALGASRAPAPRKLPLSVRSDGPAVETGSRGRLAG